jgi:hypothetical protein
MSTRLKLALALGALTLLPAAGAQAATTDEPATFIGANIIATCTSGSGEFPCEPGQTQKGVKIYVHESCDNGINPGFPQGILSNIPGGIDPDGFRQTGTYRGVVNGSEAEGAGVDLTEQTDNGNYIFDFDLSPNQSSFTGEMSILDTGATGDTGKYSVTGQRTLGPIPGCSQSAPVKKCKKLGKKSEAQSAKKKKCKKKH